MHSVDLLCFFFATNVPIGSVRPCDCAKTRLSYKNTQTVVRRWLNEMNCCCKDSAGEKWPLLLMPLPVGISCFIAASNDAGC